jgi:hypothetical protein
MNYGPTVKVEEARSFRRDCDRGTEEGHEDTVHLLGGNLSFFGYPLVHIHQPIDHNHGVGVTQTRSIRQTHRVSIDSSSAFFTDSVIVHEMA